VNIISENREKTDLDTPILFFKSELQKFIKARNWGRYHTPKNLIQALQIEAAELSELFLFKEFKIDEILKDETLLEDISDEVADVFIYLISLINALDIDLSKAFVKKMQKNSQKYTTEEFNDGTYFKK